MDKLNSEEGMAEKDNKNSLTGAFNEVVGIIEKARERAYRKVNEELILMYRDIGKYISEHAENAAYGDSFVDGLADFQNEIFEVIDDSRGKVALGYAFGQVEEIERVSIEEYIARRPLRLGNSGCCRLLREHIPFIISAVYLPLQFALTVTLSDAQSHIE